MGRFSKQILYTPKDLGINGELATGVVTSNGFGVAEYNQLTLEIEFTRVAGTGNLDFYIEVLEEGGSTWNRVQSQSISSGTTTLSDQVWRKASGGTSQAYNVSLPMNYHQVRAVFSAVTSATTDSWKVWARVGNI